MNILFIASLSHSGSTALDLTIGGHSQFVGLGEVYRALASGPNGLEKTRKETCSCKNIMDKCLFWGKVATEIEEYQKISINKKYLKLLKTFKEVFGTDSVPVDSSKYIHPLKVLNREPAVKLKVLFLIKDVRAYTISQLDLAKRKERSLRYHLSVYHFLQWYKKNKEVQNYLNKEKIPYLKIGYEELCMRTEDIMQKICDFLGKKIEPSMFLLNESGSHIIRGNRMRNQSNKKQRLNYDTRWLYRKEWLPSAIIFPNIMKFNSSEVYSNLIDK